MTAIPPIQGIAATPGAARIQATAPAGEGFNDAIGKALEAVSDAESRADAVAADVATGGESSIQDLMVAMTKASLSVDLLVQVRNRAVEAYQEIMRMQI